MTSRSSSPRQIVAAVCTVLVSFVFSAWLGPLLMPRKGGVHMADEHDPRQWMIVGDGTEAKVRRAKEAIAAKWPGRYELVVVEPEVAGELYRLRLRHAEEPDVAKASGTGGR